MSNDAYLEGTRAFLSGSSQLNNPHPAGSAQHNDFERGWVQALKRSSANFSSGSSIFAREPQAPQFAGAVPDYVDPEEEKKKAAREYAKATGRS